jgi:predicted phage-related endonuclease
MSTEIESAVQISIPELPGCALEVYDTMEKWLDARNSVIGASEAASIFGVGYADESPMSVWGRKVGKIDSKEDTDLLECGRVLQPAIIELFRRRYLKANPDCEIVFNHQPLGEYTLCRSLKHPWMGASLDDYFFDRDGVALVEAKNVSLFMAADWNDDDPPLKFHVQTQQQMAVTHTERNFAVGLIGGNRLVWKEARRNDKFIAVMVETLAEFQELVDDKVEPSGKWIDGTEATKKALGKIHPLDNGETVTLPLESAAWHEALAKAKADKKEAEGRELLYGNHLRREIGDNTAGLLPDGTRYTHKHQTKASFVMPECTFRTLRHEKGSTKRRR